MIKCPNCNVEDISAADNAAGKQCRKCIKKAGKKTNTVKKAGQGKNDDTADGEKKQSHKMNGGYKTH
ncbi:hypothetical protein GCM10027043_04640 [Ferruginibacter profundus]